MTCIDITSQAEYDARRPVCVAVLAASGPSRGGAAVIACPTCPELVVLEQDEGELWCPVEERAVTYAEARADVWEDE